MISIFSFSRFLVAFHSGLTPHPISIGPCIPFHLPHLRFCLSPAQRTRSESPNRLLLLQLYWTEPLCWWGVILLCVALSYMYITILCQVLKAVFGSETVEALRKTLSTKLRFSRRPHRHRRLPLLPPLSSSSSTWRRRVSFPLRNWAPGTRFAADDGGVQ